jgi:MFS transporter, ACS family, solute carrier family 17 (sodium-dependent inorganic phosphate cotransporter), member 5
MLAVSGVLASSSMGWPSIFYFSGVAGLVWSILYFFYGASSPSDCPEKISTEERNFIESSLNTGGDHGSRVSQTVLHLLINWFLSFVKQF